MPRSNPIACTTEQTQLGEGTRWDDRYQELLHVDILSGRVYRYKINDKGALSPVRTHDIPGTVGAIAPVLLPVGTSAICARTAHSTSLPRSRQRARG